MNLLDFLEENKSSIIKKWFDRVVETYPVDTAVFLKKQKDPFGNPVGSTTQKALETAFNQLLKDETDSEMVQSALDPVIRIRAVQTHFSPSQAAGFPLFLKKIIRDGFKCPDDAGGLKQLMDFELKIDELMLIAFNIYMQCRETVFQLKTNAEHERVFRTLSRAGLLKKVPEDGPDLEVP
jgi:hypothetical protein